MSQSAPLEGERQPAPARADQLRLAGAELDRADRIHPRTAQGRRTPARAPSEHVGYEIQVPHASYRRLNPALRR